MTPFPVLYRQQQAEQTTRTDSLPRRTIKGAETTPRERINKKSPCDRPAPPPSCRGAVSRRREG